MMISPEMFYDIELAGKSARDIKKVIDSLKREMNRLVEIMENPTYRPMMLPDESTRLACTREYLTRAKQALEEAGGRYKPTKEELKAEEFEQNIPYIQKIVYTTNSFFGSNEQHIMDLSEEVPRLEIKLWPFEEDDREGWVIEHELSKEEFLQEVYRIHIGEWQNLYVPQRFGYCVCDGTQWDLQIFYSNGKDPVTIEGDNIWPHNFDKFLMLMGMEPERGEPEDEE